MDFTRKIRATRQFWAVSRFGIAVMASVPAGLNASVAIAQDQAAIDGRNLRIVEVSSPEINCVFDRDCRITVNDFSERFTLPFATGQGFLQSRQYPIGEPGTKAEGLYPYLYRIDLTQMRNETAARCIRSVKFDFDSPATLRYGNRRPRLPAQVFAITKNAIGTAKPTRAIRDDKGVEFQFRELCTAGPNDNVGTSSVFFGMTSKSPPGTVKARMTDQDGRAIVVLAKAAQRKNTRVQSTQTAPVRGAAGTVTVPPRTVTPDGVVVTTPLPGTYEGITDPVRRSDAEQATSPRSGPTTLGTATKSDGVIGFEEYRAESNGIKIVDQYREEFGVAFKPGVTVHQCGGLSSGPKACTYVRAADGTRTGYFDGRSNNGRMMMTFARPIKELSMRVNATGAKPEEAFSFEMLALQGRQVVAASQEKFVWSLDRNTNWPVTARVSITNPRGATTVTAQMRANSQNNQPIRFLFDEIKITYADSDPITDDGRNPQSSPVGAAIFSRDQARADAAIGPAERVSWPSSVLKKKSRFKPAPRFRARINWADAEAAVAEQNRLGQKPAPLISSTALDRAELPVLLPPSSDQPIDLAVTRSGNTYSAVFRSGGRLYDYYGTRMLTDLGKPKGGADTRDTNPIRYFEGETGLSASFTVYGAVYRINRTCKQESPRLDPDCYDLPSMEKQIRALMVALGSRAGERP